MKRVVSFIVISALTGCAAATPKNAESKEPESCLKWLPSNYLPAAAVADIRVAPRASKKFWTWGIHDYMKQDEFSKSGSVYSFDLIEFNSTTVCATVEGGSPSDIAKMKIPQNVEYLLVKDSKSVDLKNVSDFPRLRAVVILRSRVENLFSPPPPKLNGIVLIDTNISSRDIDYLPKM